MIFKDTVKSDSQLVKPDMSDKPVALAKLIWTHPETGALQEFVLHEGDTVRIGRSQDNEIYIQERTVSRHHASVIYKSGVFTIQDMVSANGVFVNDERVTEPYPLIHGDVIRLFTPILRFEALPFEADSAPPLIDESQMEQTAEKPLPIEAMEDGLPYLTIASGDRMGERISLDQEVITFGRAVSNATWDITLPDHAVSRPHARVYKQDEDWFVEDLGSSNGTMVGGNFISRPIRLVDETIITMGETTIIFHDKPD